MINDILVLGGAGLVGIQVCRRLVRELAPRRIVVASLLPREAEEAVTRLRAELGEGTEFVPESGNLFVPSDLAGLERGAILANPALRRRLLDGLYGDFDQAYRDNHLVGLLHKHRPQAVIDSVNTATGFSYQDVFDGVARVRDWLRPDGYDPRGVDDLEAFLLSQSAPQLIRHVRFLHRATSELGVGAYIKIGTTGTGGMGLNIPYTHSEDRPSQVLLAKTEAAFGHSGLLFLMARTPGAPIVKEVKPAAMIGYRGLDVRAARDKHGNGALFQPREQRLGGALHLREPDADWPRAGELRVPIVDTGENGVFTRGEFAAITALGQMEFITPEEIAQVVVQELRGGNTGRDVLAALDGSVLGPTYRAGLLRSRALLDLARIEADSGLPSIALGKLGPPELSKLLFEAHLLRRVWGSLEALADDQRAPEALSEAAHAALESSSVVPLAPSIGIPVLLPDGQRLLRGPRINVPQLLGHATTVEAGEPALIDSWARRGWIDLRPANLALWQARARLMLGNRVDRGRLGSEAASIHAWSGEGFEIGDVVAWIFNNEMGGYRVK